MGEAKAPQSQDAIIAKRKAWYVAHREECIARSRAWYRDNTDRAKAAMVAWAAAHPKRVKAHRASRVEKKRAEDRNYSRLHAAANRERATVWNREHKSDRKTTYVARVKTAGGSHTLAEWEALLDSYHGLCVYCLRPTTGRDHVVPLSRGGPNDIDNIVPACRSCNSRKHRMPLLVWLAVRRGAMEKVA